MPDKTDVLLEEWKQSVALYMDQDRRGFERIKMFLLLHAGLLVFYGTYYRAAPGREWGPLLLVAMIALASTAITWMMSARAHTFVLLRVAQAMLIESRLNALVRAAQPGAAGGEQEQSEDANQDSEERERHLLLTTFTREHVLFRRLSTDPKASEEWPREWNHLEEEIRKLGEYVYQPFDPKSRWKWSVGHLRWLKWSFGLIGVLWLGLAVLPARSLWDALWMLLQSGVCTP